MKAAPGEMKPLVLDACRHRWLTTAAVAELVADRGGDWTVDRVRECCWREWRNGNMKRKWTGRNYVYTTVIRASLLDRYLGLIPKIAGRVRRVRGRAQA